MAREKNPDASLTPELLASGVHRRSFLKYVAAAFGTAMLPDMVAGCADGTPTPVGSVGTPYDFTTLPPPVWAVRPDDMVSLGFQFANLAVDANRNLVATNAGDAYVVVTFPPQHIIEDEFVPPGYPTTVPPYATSRAAGASRVVFKVPPTFTPVPYTLQGVLTLCAESSTVVPTNALSYVGYSSTLTTTAAALPKFSAGSARIDRALAASEPAAGERVAQRVQTAFGIVPQPLPPLFFHTGTSPVPPAAGETSLEIPHRVLMSPTEKAVWRHATAPVVSPAGRTELWHTRLAIRNPRTGIADERLGGRTMRALWTRDYDIYNSTYGTTGVPNPPFNAVTGNNKLSNYVSDPLPTGGNPSVDNRDRLVRDTGDLSGAATTPLTVDRLILSPLGATVDMKGAWPNDQQLLEYCHSIALGRDVHVEVAQSGWVLPCMTQATLLTISQRNTDPGQGAIGALYRWSVVLIGKPLVSFVDGRDGTTLGVLRQWPFAGVEILQKVIPCQLSGADHVHGWLLPKNGGTTFLQIAARGVDVGGSNTNVRFQTPLYFVPDTGSGLQSSGTTAFGEWNAQPPAITLDGQRMAFAPANHDETSFEAQQLTITMAPVPPATSTTVTVGSMVPVATALNLSVEAIRHLTGNQNAGTTFEYHTTYLGSGFDATANPHEVILQVTGPRPSMSLGTARATGGVSPGFVSPDMAIAYLSRKAGPISSGKGTLQSTDLTQFNPASYFGDLPLLFGFIRLSEVLQPVLSDATKYLPKCVTQALADAERFIQQVYDFYQKLQSWVSTAQQLATQVQNQINDATNQINAILAKIPMPVGTAPAGSPNLATATDLLTLRNLQAFVGATGIGQKQLAQVQAIVAAVGTLNPPAGILGDVQNLINDIEASNFPALFDQGGTPGHLTSLLNDVSQKLMPALGGPDITSIVGGLQKDINKAWGLLQTFFQDASTIASLASELQNVANGLAMAKNMTVKLEWRPKLGGLVSASGGMFRPVSDQALYLGLEVRAKAINGKPAGADITCRLDQFLIGFGSTGDQIRLAGLDPNELNDRTKMVASFLASGAPPDPQKPMSQALTDLIASAYVSLVFDHMQFQMLAGHKPDVDVVFNGIHFGGPLKFIETLRNAIPLDGFSDPPYVDVQSDHVEAGFNLAIPNVAVGMFSMENIKISAALTIPLLGDGKTTLGFRFSFCTKEHPFLVTVAMLGGGGYFAMEMDAKGLTKVEAAIEVCAQLSINLGVAAGCVSIEAGVYFSYGAADGIQITGYLRIRGSVSVLGLITLSVELYMSLSYYAKTGKVIGHASIVVEVDVAFFSESVSISCERKFAGSNGDPTFEELMSPATTSPPPAVLPGTQWIPSTYEQLGAAPAYDPFGDYCVAYAAA